MEIEKYINERWSPRAFDDQEIESKILKEVFAAAGRAPSAFNEQPWSFVIGEKNTDSYQKIFDCLGEWNQKWAITAPVLIIAISKKTYSKNGKDNAHAKYDLGAAVAHLSMKAFEHELYVHQMAGFDAEKAREVLEIPENFEAVTAIALGRKGNKEQLPEDIAKTEKGVSKRNDVEEYVFTNSWGNSF